MSNRPAEIAFGDDPDDEEIGHERPAAVAESSSAKPAEKKSNKKLLLIPILGGAFILLLLAAFAYSQFFSNPTSKGAPSVGIRQPTIRQAPSAAQQAAVMAAQRTQLAEQAVADQLAAAGQQRGSVGAEQAAALTEPNQTTVSAAELRGMQSQLAEAMKAIAGLTAKVEILQKGLEGVASNAQKSPTTAPTNAPSQKAVVPSAQTPHPSVPAKQPVKKPQDEIVTYAPIKATYCVTGLVGNRVFVVRRNLDGSETEATAIVGEKIEGVPVQAINPASREVSMVGGQKITVSGPGCGRG